MTTQELTWVKACTVSDIDDDCGYRVDLPHTVAIFRRNGVYYAIDDTCPHGDASLAEGFVEEDKVECPLHGACFSLRTGQVLSAPATTDVRTYPVEVRGDDIFVGLSEG